MSPIRSRADAAADATTLVAKARPAARRGACPSLAAPMPTGDGLLARLTPIGGLTPRQLAALAAAAGRFGNGIVEISARGSLQVRGLDTAGAAALADLVADQGITPAAGVPITVSPLAGLDPTAAADPRPLVARLRAALDASFGVDGVPDGASGDAGRREPAGCRIGPKVAVVVEDGGAVPLDAVTGDVRLAAVAPGHWRLGLAGDAERATWTGVFDEAGAVAATIAILARVAADGRAARVRTVLPAAVQLAERAASAEPTFRASRSTAAHAPEEPPRLRDAAWLGPFTLADGRGAYGTALPFGFTGAAVLEDLAVAAAGADTLVFAPPHGLVVLGATAAVAVCLDTVARRHDLVVAADDPRRAVSACAGTSGCASGLIAARDLAPALTMAAAPLIAAGGHLHVSGCGKGCAHPAAADLVVVGLDGGVGIGHEARAAAAPVETVPVADVAAAVARHAAHLAGRRR